MYHRLLLHTFLVVLCHRKVVLGQYHGTYYPSAPRVAIGPYRPWEGHFPPPIKTLPHPVAGRMPLNHPGYQTNIIIDQTGDAKSIVEITTEDLSTGLEVGKTEWSGPGTLTLSAIAGLLESPRHHKRDSQHARPRHGYLKEQDHHYGYPSGHPKNEFELIEVPTYHAPIQKPTEILGTRCNSDYDCTKALNAVCSLNPKCEVHRTCHQRTCQCPPLHHPHLNEHVSKPYRHSHHYEVNKRKDVINLYNDELMPPKRKRRSSKYYEECKFGARQR